MAKRASTWARSASRRRRRRPRRSRATCRLRPGRLLHLRARRGAESEPVPRRDLRALVLPAGHGRSGAAGSGSPRALPRVSRAGRQRGQRDAHRHGRGHRGRSIRQALALGPARHPRRVHARRGRRRQRPIDIQPRRRRARIMGHRGHESGHELGHAFRRLHDRRGRAARALGGHHRPVANPPRAGNQVLRHLRKPRKRRCVLRARLGHRHPARRDGRAQVRPHSAAPARRAASPGLRVDPADPRYVLGPPGAASRSDRPRGADAGPADHDQDPATDVRARRRDRPALDEDDRGNPLVGSRGSQHHPGLRRESDGLPLDPDQDRLLRDPRPAPSPRLRRSRGECARESASELLRQHARRVLRRAPAAARRRSRWFSPARRSPRLRSPAPSASPTWEAPRFRRSCSRRACWMS